MTLIGLNTGHVRALRSNRCASVRTLSMRRVSTSSNAAADRVFGRKRRNKNLARPGKKRDGSAPRLALAAATKPTQRRKAAGTVRVSRLCSRQLNHVLLHSSDAVVRSGDSADAFGARNAGGERRRGIGNRQQALVGDANRDPSRGAPASTALSALPALAARASVWDLHASAATWLSALAEHAASALAGIACDEFVGAEGEAGVQDEQGDGRAARFTACCARTTAAA